MSAISIGQAPFEWERARRFVRHHGDVVGNYGQLTAGSSRATDGLCRMILDTGIGANRIAETTEHFHRDFMAYQTAGQDIMWRKTQLVEGYFIPEVVDNPSGEAFISVGIGSPNSRPPFVYDENYIGLRYNLTLGRWEAVVNCPGAFTVNVADLGALPLVGTTWGYKCRILYEPKKQVRFWLNDALVHTFTDATQLQQLWDDAISASDEIGAYFVSTGPGATGQTSAVFGPMYCETLR